MTHAPGAIDGLPSRDENGVGDGEVGGRERAPGTPPPDGVSPTSPPTAAALDEAIERVIAAGAPLRCMTLGERVDAIDRAAAEWLAPESSYRRRALAELPAITGYPARTIATGLDNLARALAASELHSTARQEAAARTPYGSRLAFHVLSGNVPGAGVFGMVGALLAGIPSVVKTARREPLLPVLIAESLTAVDPRLGGALAVAHWDAGDHALTRRAVERADVVLAYGRAESLDAIAAYHPRRLLRFGPRMSVVVITRDAVGRRAARDTAWQTALFDQQGCLSPQVVVVEETARTATSRFLAALSEELGRLASELPLAPLAIEETAAISRYLERQRWRAQEGSDVTVDADTAGRFSVVCDRTAALIGSPLNRHVIVVPVASLADARSALLGLRGIVEAVGFAGPARRSAEVAALAAAWSASRLCPLDRMQAPPFSWRQSGHPRIACFAGPPPSDGARGHDA